MKIRLLSLALLAATLIAHSAPPALAQGAGAGPDQIPISSLPFAIVKSGSYYLTGSLSGTAQGGILLMASNVCIDLNGYSLIGTAECGNAISAPTLVNNVTVANGTIRDWPAIGVHLVNGTSCRVVGVTVINCGKHGIWVGDRGLVADCLAESNGETGIEAGNHSVVRDSRSLNNKPNGIQVFDFSVVADCTAQGNAVTGIRAHFNDRITGNLVTENLFEGVRVERRCTLTDNSVSGSPTGILVMFTRNQLRGNDFSTCPISIELSGSANLVVGSTFAETTTPILTTSLGNLVGPLLGSSDMLTNLNPHANYRL